MNMPSQPKLLATLVALILAGCGDGSSSSAGGEIDGFGSVIVNGVHYDTDSAEVVVDEEPGSEDPLEVGQIVELLGRLDGQNKGVANKIFMRTRVAGTLDSIDSEARTFTVMNYTVVIGTDTKLGEGIDEVTLDGLVSGAQVRVSGTPTETGEIGATRVDIHTETDVAVGQHTYDRLFGQVELIDVNTMTLVVGGQTIDYSSAVLSGDRDNLAADSRILARGTLMRSASMEDVLIAEKLYVISSMLREDGSVVTGSTESRATAVEVEGTERPGEGRIQVDRVKIKNVSRPAVVGAYEVIWAEGYRSRQSG